MKTIFGEICIYDDNEPVDYEIVELPKEAVNYRVDARYMLTVKNIRGATRINCVLQMIDEHVVIEKESGYKLELISFIRDNIKLSIGTEGEIQGLSYVYLENGIEVSTNENASVDSVIFYLAWITMEDVAKEEIYTWFAADPTYRK